jgi:hypothetical protein
MKAVFAEDVKCGALGMRYRDLVVWLYRGNTGPYPFSFTSIVPFSAQAGN